MKEEKGKNKKDFGMISYTLGIISVIMAFFSPLPGLIFGITGLVLSKKQVNEFSASSKKLNIWGIVLSTILFIIQIAVAIYFTKLGIQGLALN